MFGSISYLVVLQKDWHLFLCTEDCKAFSLFVFPLSLSVLYMFLLIYLQLFKSLKKKKKFSLILTQTQGNRELMC